MEPFEASNPKEFQEELLQWIGDVFYDILPEHDYEIRDEQIYTAYKIADAVCDKKVHLAEAGLGTGKTFAYLLSAIPYARYTKKPVIIACATSALQEQLAGESGDIQTLSKLLSLDVDVRMAKDPRDYVCDQKLEEGSRDFGEWEEEVTAWLHRTTRGERAELPSIPDRIWNQMSWDNSRDCDVCDARGYCKLVKAREHYRATRDLIIVDHATFFHDLWTRQERIAEGKRPILPEYSAVIFDEGHKVLLPAALQAGYQINQEELQQMIDTLQEIQGARESLENATLVLEDHMNLFFDALQRAMKRCEGSERYSVELTSTLSKVAGTFLKALDRLLLELQIEQELYFVSIPTTWMQAYEGQLERAILALRRFTNANQNMLSWVDAYDQSFWVVPKQLKQMLQTRLYDQKIPVVFTSATLSNAGNFDYISQTLGLSKATKSTIGSPFELEEQVEIEFLNVVNGTEQNANNRYDALRELLVSNGGRALVLTNSMQEVARIRHHLKEYTLPFTVYYEDEAERGYLVKKMKEEETSVLVGANFWEGIDVPGDALNLLIVWQLPFPASDPLIDLQREEVRAAGGDPSILVDAMQMGLKLKQGCGRLIRSSTDKGRIVLCESVFGEPWEQMVLDALPIRYEEKKG